MGAGVPRPVHPKSHTQRRATANPIKDGTAAIHRQRAAPAISTLKPSHCGSSQNHKEKNTAPTAREASVVSPRWSCPFDEAFSDCVFAVICFPPPKGA